MVKKILCYWSLIRNLFLYLLRQKFFWRLNSINFFKNNFTIFLDSFFPLEHILSASKEWRMYLLNFINGIISIYQSQWKIKSNILNTPWCRPNVTKKKPTSHAKYSTPRQLPVSETCYLCFLMLLLDYISYFIFLFFKIPLFIVCRNGYIEHS